MTERRFTDKPDLNPEAVKALPAYHDAIKERRTLFPSTVVEVTESEPEHLLISGFNNKKLGDTIAKGKFAGYKLFQLSLEERATCNAQCEHFQYCYGNGMQYARRLRMGDPETFYDRLSAELGDLLRQHGKIMVRLHVLGDFISVEYVQFWMDMIDLFEGDLAVYGYTRWRPEDDIGREIERAKVLGDDLFRIRWSGLPGPDGALVIDRKPEAAKVSEGLVCPAQTDATACCATCGLCWDRTKQPIVFVKHGPANQGIVNRQVLESVEPAGDDGLRQIAPIQIPKKIVPAALPKYTVKGKYVPPGDLLVEEAYQRDLSVKSLNLIRRIVAGWDWCKFKPPICAELSDGRLVVIDGQHTAIAAMTHGGIEKIPVMIMPATAIAQRAEAFVSHNRDRVVMTQGQVFHAQVAAGDELACRVAAWCEEAGAFIPKNQVQKGKEQHGQITSVSEIMALGKRHDKQSFQDILLICILSGHKPIKLSLLRAAEMIVTHEYFQGTRLAGPRAIAEALAKIENPDAACRIAAAETGQNRSRALAIMIADRVVGVAA